MEMVRNKFKTFLFLFNKNLEYCDKSCGNYSLSLWEGISEEENMIC